MPPSGFAPGKATQTLLASPFLLLDPHTSLNTISILLMSIFGCSTALLGLGKPNHRIIVSRLKPDAQIRLSKTCTIQDMSKPTATVVVSSLRAGVWIGLPIHSPRKLLQLLKLDALCLPVLIRG